MRSRRIGFGKVAALVAVSLVPVVASAVPTPMPDVAYYHMDEQAWNLGGADVFDSAMQVYRGWAHNGAHPVDGGKSGRAGSFDGVNDEFDYTGPVPGQITLEAWIKSDTLGSWSHSGCILGKPGAYYLEVVPDGTLHTYFYGVSPQQWQNGPNLSQYAGEWVHVAATFDGSERAIYVNGVKEASRPTTGSVNTGGGTHRVGHVDSNRYFQGLIDKAAIYSRGLTGAEIQRRYELGSDPEVLHAPMNENPPTYNNTPSGQPPTRWFLFDETTPSYRGWSQGGATTVANGYEGRAGRFDGANDFVNYGVIPAMTPRNQISVEAWIRPDPGSMYDTSNWRYGRPIYSAPGSVYVDIGSRGHLNTLYQGTSAGWLGGPDMEPYEGKWTHIAATYDGTREVIYVNGVERASQLSSGLINATSSNPRIGHVDWWRYYKGLMDNFSIHSRALSPEEIAQRAKPRPNLVYLEMNEPLWDGTPGQVIDSSGRGHHGTSQGNATTVSGSPFPGRAGMFDGSGDFVNLGNSSALNPSAAMTLEAWIRPEAVGQGAGWQFGQSIISRPHAYHLEIGNTGELVCWFGHGWLIGPDMTPYDGEWVHVAAMFDGVEQALYLGGVEVASMPAIGSIPSSSYATQVGYADYSRYFQGRIDNAGIYDWALSPEQIRMRVYIPEPTTLVLLGAGLLALRRRKRR